MLAAHLSVPEALQPDPSLEMAIAFAKRSECERCGAHASPLQMKRIPTFRDWDEFHFRCGSCAYHRYVTVTVKE